MLFYFGILDPIISYPTGMLGSWSVLPPALLVPNGADVQTLTRVWPIGTDATQATSAKRPAVDTATFPGLSVPSFVNDDSLDATPAGPISTIVLVIDVPSSLAQEITFISRDTSQVGTVKPAFEVSVY